MEVRESKGVGEEIGIRKKEEGREEGRDERKRGRKRMKRRGRMGRGGDARWKQEGRGGERAEKREERFKLVKKGGRGLDCTISIHLHVWYVYIHVYTWPDTSVVSGMSERDDLILHCTTPNLTHGTLPTWILLPPLDHHTNLF